MADYTELKGLKVKYLSDDPSPGTVGDVWYNTAGQLKAFIATAAWSAGAPVGTGRDRQGAAGASNSSGLIFGGQSTGTEGKTEEYNGTGWTESGDLNTARFAGGGMGTQTAALMGGGQTGPGSPPFPVVAETYDGSTWTEVSDLGTQRYGITGAGTQTAGLVFGGTHHPSRAGETEEFDGTSWTESGDLNTDRGYLHGFGTQTAAVGAGGMIAPGDTATSNVEEYNGSTWSEVTNTPAVTYKSGAAGTLTAGLTVGKAPAANTCLYYDGTSWTTAPNLGTGRAGVGSDGTQASAFAGGGHITADTAATEEFNITHTVVTAGAWANGGNTAVGRRAAGGAGTQTAALFFGGSASTGIVGNSEEYDGSSWTEGNNLGTAGYAINGTGTQTAALAAGRFSGPPGIPNASEEYDGTNWAEGDNLNTARAAGGMAGTQTAAALFGGSEGPNFASGTNGAGEEYNGSSWTETNDMNTARRYLSGIGTQTAALGISGYSPGGGNAQVESYDGSSWTEGPDVLELRRGGGTSGTQTAALFFSGDPRSSPNTSVKTESYDGTAWATGPNMATTRRLLTGSPAGTSTSALGASGYVTAPVQNTEEFTGETATDTASTIDFD